MPVLLVLAFIVVPLLELYVIIQVGQLIGGWQTIGLLLLVSFLGSVLLRREGRRAWRSLTAALGSARLPSREIADGALVIVGGTLLLTPGFLTDLVGLFFLFPLTRPVARRLLLRLAAGRLLRRVGGRGAGGAPAPGRPGEGRRRGPDPRVVPGEVIEGPIIGGPIVERPTVDGEDPPRSTR